MAPEPVSVSVHPSEKRGGRLWLLNEDLIHVTTRPPPQEPGRQVQHVLSWRGTSGHTC